MQTAKVLFNWLVNKLPIQVAELRLLLGREGKYHFFWVSFYSFWWFLCLRTKWKERENLCTLLFLSLNMDCFLNNILGTIKKKQKKKNMVLFSFFFWNKLLDLCSMVDVWNSHPKSCPASFLIPEKYVKTALLQQTWEKQLLTLTFVYTVIPIPYGKQAPFYLSQAGLKFLWSIRMCLFSFHCFVNLTSGCSFCNVEIRIPS